MTERKKWIVDLVVVIILLTSVVFLFKANYSPNTFLTGWDNLMPELNLKLNIQRSFSAAWQEYQGVGLLGGMAHAADLSRQLILFPFSLFVPVDLIRYGWTFLMLLIGPLGVYFFISKILIKENDFISRLGGFAGATFYLFNLATVQYFFVPYESFVSFYGFFPWLLYFALRFLNFSGKKNLLIFSVVSLLGTSAFYVQTMFLVYIVFLAIFIFGTILQKRLRGFFRSLWLMLITFCVNAFWLLPAAYFTLTSSFIPALSHINSIATPETLFMNQASGSWQNIIQLKGFWFNYYDFFSNGKFDYMFRDWIPWVNSYAVFLIMLALVITSLLGIVVSLFRKKVRYAISLTVLFVISFFMLGSVNPPMGRIYAFISSKIPLFSDIFRSVFTKWSIAFAFVIACGIGYFISFTQIIQSKIKYFLSMALLILAIGGSIYSVFPVFQGKLISEKIKVNIPVEYFEATAWFNQQSDGGRVVTLPFVNFFGWTFTNWGFNGSGFLWYGVKNPILDRAFDVWSPYNETFYNQASFALFNKDLIGFENVLKKFQVKYLLLDESVINAGGNSNLLFVPEIKSMLTASQYITKSVSFGFLTVYEANWEIGKDFVSVPKTYVGLNSDTLYSKIDTLFAKYGDYYQDEKGLGYPFINLDIRRQVVITGDNNNLTFTNKTKNASVTLLLEDVVSEVLSINRGFDKATNCDIGKIGKVTKENGKEGIIYTATGGGVSCDFLPYPDFKYSQGYILHIRGGNITGRSLKIYLQNSQTGRMDLEELLPEGVFNVYYPILPQKLPGQGYTLNLETRSFGNVASENILEKVEFIPFSFDFLTGLIQKGEKEDIPVVNNLTVLEQKQIVPYVWKVTVKGEGLLQLGQGYEKGWLAFGGKVAKKNILTHVQVNGWANGWFVSNGVSTVYIFFWPQGLEWLGMILAIL